MGIILEDIIRNKKREIEEKKKNSGANFLERIINPKTGEIGLIAEIKLASPSSGVLGKEKDVVARAVMYERGGADAISVVTDRKYFGGDLDLVRKIKKAVSLPILMKDFVIDPFQVYEAKMYGADALLFIAKILTKEQLKELVSRAVELGIEPVVEIQSGDELKKVHSLGERQQVECIAVNARDLKSFRVDVEKACQLMRSIPDGKVILGFSGVKGREEVEKYKQAGAKAVLVGTPLMKARDIEKFIKSLKDL